VAITVTSQSPTLINALVNVTNAHQTPTETRTSEKWLTTETLNAQFQQKLSPELAHPEKLCATLETLLKSLHGAEKKFPELKSHAAHHQLPLPPLNLNVPWFAVKESKPSPVTTRFAITRQLFPKCHALVNGVNSFKPARLNGQVVQQRAEEAVNNGTSVPFAN